MARIKNSQTVDDFIENQTKSIMDTEVLNIIVSHHSTELLRILQSEYNKPSKWDLSIIDVISKLKRPNHYHLLMMCIYRDRK